MLVSLRSGRFQIAAGDQKLHFQVVHEGPGQNLVGLHLLCLDVAYD